MEFLFIYLFIFLMFNPLQNLFLFWGVHSPSRNNLLDMFKSFIQIHSYGFPGAIIGLMSTFMIIWLREILRQLLKHFKQKEKSHLIQLVILLSSEYFCILQY